MREQEIDELNEQFQGLTPQEVIADVAKRYRGEIAFSTSFSIEDQVITDMICKGGERVRIFTLDTGRLFPETYDLIERTREHYGINIEVYFPDHNRVEAMVFEHGINLFYKSLEFRHLCCDVRKIEPLRRAIGGVKVWICGLRREQSVTRREMQLIERAGKTDSETNLLKLNPLIDWSSEDVLNYIKRNNVPYNKLHDLGYPSIGCAPCTRPVKEGEDIRSGRWWWEDQNHRECGLHNQKQ